LDGGLEEEEEEEDEEEGDDVFVGNGFVSPSRLQLPPKNEHPNSPNNNTKNRNNI
jgi:hypothetical protein